MNNERKQTHIVSSFVSESIYRQSNCPRGTQAGIQPHMIQSRDYMLSH